MRLEYNTERGVRKPTELLVVVFWIVTPCSCTCSATQLLDPEDHSPQFQRRETSNIIRIKFVLNRVHLQGLMLTRLYLQVLL
jgi:hypothetical protein